MPHGAKDGEAPSGDADQEANHQPKFAASDFVVHGSGKETGPQIVATKLRNASFSLALMRKWLPPSNKDTDPSSKITALNLFSGKSISRVHCWVRDFLISGPGVIVVIFSTGHSTYALYPVNH